MEIIQEIFPNGMPIILVDKTYSKDGVTRKSFHVYPVIESGGQHVVLEELPLELPELLSAEYEEYHFKDYETRQEKYKK